MSEEYFRLNKGWRYQIEQVSAVRETEKFVTLENGIREAKRSEHYEYHETFEAAKQAAINHASERVERAESRLKREKEGLQNAEALTNHNQIGE